MIIIYSFSYKQKGGKSLNCLNQKEGKVLRHISIIIKLIRAITAMLAQIKDLIS